MQQPNQQPNQHHNQHHNQHLDWIKRIRAHAAANYDKGWDIIVEAYTDEELIAEFNNAQTYEQALKEVSDMVEIRYERRQEIESTIW